MTGPEPRTIHCTELPPLGAGTELVVEWDFYRRMVERLLAEGHEGKHVLIKGEEVVGLYDTHGEAMAEGYKRFLLTGFFVHEIQTRERVVRVSCWWW